MPRGTNNALDVLFARGGSQQGAPRTYGADAAPAAFHPLSPFCGAGAGLSMIYRGGMPAVVTPVVVRVLLLALGRWVHLAEVGVPFVGRVLQPCHRLAILCPVVRPRRLVPVLPRARLASRAIKTPIQLICLMVTIIALKRQPYVMAVPRL